MKRAVHTTLPSAKRSREAGTATALPPGASLIEGFLSADEERQLLTHIDSAPWNTTLKRRTQHYGVEYDYKKKWIAGEAKGSSAPPPPLPAWCTFLIDRLRERGTISSAPVQLLVNEYEPGQGISRHSDSPAFGDMVLSISLGSACTMQLRLGDECITVHLPRRSVLVLSGDARWKWTHEIAARKSDVIGGVKVRAVGVHACMESNALADGAHKARFAHVPMAQGVRSPQQRIQIRWRLFIFGMNSLRCRALCQF